MSKYFRVNEGEAECLTPFWEYYKLPDECEISDAVSKFDHNNPWVKKLDSRNTHSEELTEEQFKAGIQFNNIFKNQPEEYEFQVLRYNLFPTLAIAKMFCDKKDPSGYVRIGYENAHNVYKINQEGNFIFVYHYNSVNLGKLRYLDDE